MAQPGSPQATRYFILLHVLQVDFMQGGQQTLRLTTLLIDQGIPNHDFLLYRGSTVLQLSCPYPDFGAPQFPIPMRDSWCATLIRRKAKEEYRAPSCTLALKGLQHVQRRLWENRCISLQWYAQDSRMGCRVLISQSQSGIPASKSRKFNPMSMSHLNTGQEFGSIESEWNSYMEIVTQQAAGKWTFYRPSKFEMQLWRKLLLNPHSNSQARSPFSSVSAGLIEFASVQSLHRLEKARL